MRHCYSCHKVNPYVLCDECIETTADEMDSVDKMQDNNLRLEFRQDTFCVLFTLVVISVLILSFM